MRGLPVLAGCGAGHRAAEHSAPRAAIRGMRSMRSRVCWFLVRKDGDYYSFHGLRPRDGGHDRRARAPHQLSLSFTSAGAVVCAPHAVLG